MVVSGRRDKQGQELVAELQGLGAEAIFVRSDVRKDEDVRNLVDQTVMRFGRLDIAVNNAGTEGSPGLVTDQTAESYAATFDTNVLGTLLSMKHELRVMLPQGSRSIVNVSSAYGSVGAAGASVYVASKHAVEGLTKSAALEVAGTGIRVNVVAPGTTDTGMVTRFTNTDQNKAAQAGTYDVKYAVKMFPTRGIGQLSVNGTNLGPATDLYSNNGNGVFKEFDMGPVTLSAPGNYTFKFSVTGHNTASSSYTLAFDYIKLTPQ